MTLRLQIDNVQKRSGYERFRQDDGECAAFPGIAPDGNSSIMRVCYRLSEAESEAGTRFSPARVATIKPFKYMG